jgi:hypothetical protein
MPRFVVLHHVMPAGSDRPSHWDLMLETGDSLRTWALPLAPTVGQGQTVDALAAHRLAYLEYEGPVSGDRGEVTRWDAGEFELLGESASRLELRLRGEKLDCTVILTQLPDSRDRWQISLAGAE